MLSIVEMSQSCMRVAINSYSLLSSQHVQRTGTPSVSLDVNNHNHSQKIIIFGLVFWMKMLKLWEIRSLASSHIASTWQISVLNSSLRLSPSPTTILPLSPLCGTVMQKEDRDGKELCLLKAWYMFSTRRSAHALSHLIHLPHLERQWILQGYTGLQDSRSSYSLQNYRISTQVTFEKHD